MIMNFIYQNELRDSQITIWGDVLMYGLLILNFVIPFVMIFVGYILKKHPVKDMNSGNGYNTPSSRKSQEHWDYAQSIAGSVAKF